MNTSGLTSLLRDHPLVVTGLGSLSAAGDSVPARWQAALAGQSLATWREFQIGPTSKRFAVCSAPELTAARPDWQSIGKLDRCAQMAWLAAH